MERRDLIKDEIEQLGKALAKIIGDFLGLSSPGDFGNKIESTNQQLKDELDIDIDAILEMNQNQLQQYVEQRKLQAFHLENLADYFERVADHSRSHNKSLSGLYLRKAIDLLNSADDLSNELSYERLGRKQTLKGKLKQIGN